MLIQAIAMTVNDASELPKRLVVWVVEMISVAIAMGPVLVLISGRTTGASLARDVIEGQVLAGTFLFMSGFAITTAFLSAFSGRKRLWLYPLISAALWVAHVQFLSSGVSLPDKSNLGIKMAGALVVLLCTSIGTYCLRRWVGTTGASASHG